MAEGDIGELGACGIDAALQRHLAPVLEQLRAQSASSAESEIIPGLLPASFTR